MKIEQHVGSDRLEKPVSTLAMIPKTAAITRIGRQAYTVMLLIAREQGREDTATGMFCAPLNTVIRGFKGNVASSSDLKKHLRSMVTHVVEWQSPSPNETMEWGACALLSEVRLFKKNGENWLSWSYPPSLRQEMLNPQRYAQIRRSTIAQFRTHAGLALYEICARYKDNPSHMTSKQHWQWWLPVLTGKPVPDEIRTEFRFFNRDTIKPAVDEVNEVSELTVTAHEHKVGRTVEYLQFEVHKKPDCSGVTAQPVNLTEVVRAQKLGINVEIAEDLYLRHGALAFAKAIDRLAARIAMPGTPVFSRHAYLKVLLTGRAIDEVSIPAQAASAVESLDKPVARAVTNEAELRHDRLQERESERVRKVRAEIEALDAQSLSRLLDELKSDLTTRNTPASAMQRLADGKWQSALVMGELIRFYWKKSRGTEWMSAEAIPRGHT
jgi:Initiator Replication protein